MENFSQPIMQPSDFHSHRTRNIIIVLIVIVAAIFLLWKYKGGVFTSTTEPIGLSPEKKAILESVIKGKTSSDINFLTHTVKDGPIIVKNGKIQPTNQVTEYQKAIILKSLLAK